MYINFEANYHHLVSQIKESLKSDEGFCIVKSFPLDDLFLEEFCDKLGNPIYETQNLNQKSIYRVELKSPDNIPAYSNTHYEFDCHTDCSNFLTPPNTVLLLCEKPDNSGGDSYISYLSDLLCEINPEEINLLKQEIYPFSDNLFSILKDNYIRYNRITLEINRNIYDLPLSEEVDALLDKIDFILDKNKKVFKLNKQDCLFINNHKVLHGRKSFPNESDRLLKRVRLNIA